MVTTGRRYTFADFLTWPDDGDDNICDILGGELVVRNVPDVNHGRLLTELLLFLGAAQDAGHGDAFTSTTAVALDYPARGMASQYVSHPDVVFVRQEREELVGDHAVEGVPDLIVEILSPTTAEDHAPGGGLWQAYERHGVPQYWIVDPPARTVAVYTLDGEPYMGGHFGAPVVLRPGDTLTFPLPPGHAVPVARLFRNVRERGRRPRGREATERRETP